MLSERITDCHVQTFAWASLGKDEALDESNFSHINYRKAAEIVAETKDLLTAEIEERQCRRGQKGKEGGAASSEETSEAEVHDLVDLLKEATLLLARLLAKQGCVSAKFGNHDLALVRGRDIVMSLALSSTQNNNPRSRFQSIFSNPGLVWTFHCRLGRSSRHQSKTTAGGAVHGYGYR